MNEAKDLNCMKYIRCCGGNGVVGNDELTDLEQSEKPYRIALVEYENDGCRGIDAMLGGASADYVFGLTQ